MKLFKELKKLGYIHYSATTIEELDDLPLNSAERISEQALVLRWFREKYELDSYINPSLLGTKKVYDFHIWFINKEGERDLFIGMNNEYTYEEAELECLLKLIELIKKQKKMKHIVKVVFGKEQVEKLYEGETLTDDELSFNVKEYEFDTLAEKSAFIKGLFESLGWEDICIPELEFTQVSKLNNDIKIVRWRNGIADA